MSGGVGVTPTSRVSNYLLGTFWVGVDHLLVGLGGGCDCCLCDCGTEKAVSILGLNCKAFTPAWLGGRPPAIWAPQICRLLAAAGRSWRSFAPPSWVHAIDATSFCYPLLLHLPLVLLFLSVTELLSSSCSCINVGLCYADTRDVTARALATSALLFLCHIICIRNF